MSLRGVVDEMNNKIPHCRAAPNLRKKLIESCRTRRFMKNSPHCKQAMYHVRARAIEPTQRKLIRAPLITREMLRRAAFCDRKFV